MKRALLALVLLAALGAGIILALNPQIVVLAREGFPGRILDPSADTALVAGTNAEGPPPGAPAPPDALARLEASGGDALLVERGGMLIFESYANGADRETLFNSYSMVKSLTAALALRAVANGHIASLDTPLPEIVPEAPPITLREALTMTGGLALPPEPPKTAQRPFDDEGFSPFAPVAELHAYGIEALLPEIEVDPALRGAFHYQSASTALVGLAVERATGRSLPDLLSEQIWRPAGASDAHWRRVPAGPGVSAYCCLHARALDWLRVGRFLMENGMGLPEPLWRDLILPDLPPEVRRAGAYGLQVRHDVLDRTGEPAQGPFAYMMGHGGQVTYMLPPLDAVVVRFGEAPQLLHSTLYEVLR